MSPFGPSRVVDRERRRHLRNRIIMLAIVAIFVISGLAAILTSVK